MRVNRVYPGIAAAAGDRFSETVELDDGSVGLFDYARDEWTVWEPGVDGTWILPRSEYPDDVPAR